MKNAIKLTLSVFLCFLPGWATAQIKLPGNEKIEAVYLTNYWGDINLRGSDNKDFSLTATHTDTAENPLILNALEGYVTVAIEGRSMYIKARKPQGFESIDLNLILPDDVFVAVKLLKGGNIYGQNLKNGVEVNSLNGSVKMEGLGAYAMISASNGEISAGFDSVNNKLPISLVTMNGGVSVQLPAAAKRDLRLISRKNGCIITDFDLNSDRPIPKLNEQHYSKMPIVENATINGGGALLFLSTENGPIHLKM